MYHSYYFKLNRLIKEKWITNIFIQNERLGALIHQDCLELLTRVIYCGITQSLQGSQDIIGSQEGRGFVTITS